ncbi:MAG: SDR family oxidoreductase [Anaerolineales bacterium]|nr:SDR family oxidoreductase [Anaerolineales bacterium]
MTSYILVTGASGYIAGQLIPRLLARGYRIRCLARNPARLVGRSWADQVEIVPGDPLRPETLPAALADVQAAYYLIHSMSSGKDYPKRDLQAAYHFARAAEAAGLEHIIYLGGLADPNGPISPHMRSRIETGQALRQGRVPVTEFRASIISGPGSISFEMIRYLTEQFPVLIGPCWLHNLSQPIAAADVIEYLLAALEYPACRGEIVEIGGPERLTYAENMLAYARARGLRRALLTLPWLPLSLMAWMVGWLTPVPAAIAYPLIEGLQAPSIVQDDRARRLFPHIQPMGYEASLRHALESLTPERVELLYDPTRPKQILKQDGFLVDVRQEDTDASPEAVFSVLSSLGGQNGWLYANFLWRLRGMLDRLLGGPGMRGRSPTLETGSLLDFYRVQAFEPPKRLLLRAELKAPGEGWMEWRVLSCGRTTRLVQIAWFAPRSVLGFLYWVLLGPIHRLVFAGLIREIVRRSSLTILSDGNQPLRANAS